MDGELDFMKYVTRMDVLSVFVKSVLAFITAILAVRISGIRLFGKTSALDNIMVLIIGSLLGRSIVRQGLFVETVIAVFFLVLIHRLVAYAGFRNKTIGAFFKGQRTRLYNNGSFDKKNMRQCRVTENDIMEAVHRTIHSDELDKVQEIYLERSGSISVITKK